MRAVILYRTAQGREREGALALFSLGTSRKNKKELKQTKRERERESLSPQRQSKCGEKKRPTADKHTHQEPASPIYVCVKRLGAPESVV